MKKKKTHTHSTKCSRGIKFFLRNFAWCLDFRCVSAHFLFVSVMIFFFSMRIVCLCMEFPNELIADETRERERKSYNTHMHNYMGWLGMSVNRNLYKLVGFSLVQFGNVILSFVVVIHPLFVRWEGNFQVTC